MQDSQFSKVKREANPPNMKLVFSARTKTILAAVSVFVSIVPAKAGNYLGGNFVQHRWYVSAAAPAGGDGSINAPFNSLASVQQASGPGDTIVIEPSSASTPPLDGGIALKPGQRLIGDGPSVVQSGASLVPDGPPVVGASGNSSLPRITNSSNATNAGDAVELANGVDVENLVIAGAYRGAIYGQDVIGVTVRGNDISGFDTSGAAGFVVQPFYATDYTPGDGTDVAAGIPAGWAAILIDAAKVSTSLSITSNYIHDGVCGDGIDIRGMNTADISAQVSFNFVTKLVQCSSVRTIEGIGTQVTASSHLRAILVGNTEANNGSAGANMDSLFVDPAESGTLIETIDHNVYMTGIGGASTNGFEYIVSNGGGTHRSAWRIAFSKTIPGTCFRS